MKDQALLDAFGRRIRELRTARGLSQEERLPSCLRRCGCRFGRRGGGSQTGFHRTYIGMVERGERNLSLTNIGVFARVFETSLLGFVGFRNQEFENRQCGFGS
jgi:transcriptional regulator with XRE-family HTH domain